MTWLHRDGQTTATYDRDLTPLLAAGWLVCTDLTHRHHMAVS